VTDPTDRGVPAESGRTYEDAAGDRTASAEDPYGRNTTVVARTVVRVVVPVILVAAVALLLQGHNLPGGGFIGGVLTATAFVLVYVIFGLEHLADILALPTQAEEGHGPVSYYRWLFSLGLAVALTAGFVPILVGLPFLTQAVLFVEGLPLFGELEVASAFAFDIGVYFTVVGALLTILGEVGSE
jgi:multicomponent Na+:H+ antiporter subunit B